jgi:hypothetical protein
MVLEPLLRILLFLLGGGLVALSLLSAMQTLVLPRVAPNPVARTVFLVMRRVFSFSLSKSRDYRKLDRRLAYYAPLSLILLLLVWLALMLIGFTLVYRAMGVDSWYTALRISGSSLMTLGYGFEPGTIITLLEYLEAAFGLIPIDLLIAFLLSMYTAFSKREVMVTLLEERAGQPSSAIEMLLRYNLIGGLDKMGEEWGKWEE